MNDLELRAVRPDEHDLLLDLWGTVWGYGPYFESYLQGDPWYEDRYTRIARDDLVRQVDRLEQQIVDLKQLTNAGESAALSE